MTEWLCDKLLSVRKEVVVVYYGVQPHNLTAKPTVLILQKKNLWRLKYIAEMVISKGEKINLSLCLTN
jgi:hypothetical protein